MVGSCPSWCLRNEDRPATRKESRPATERARRARGAVQVALIIEDGQAVITVADDGPGIPAAGRWPGSALVVRLPRCADHYQSTASDNPATASRPDPSQPRL